MTVFTQLLAVVDHPLTAVVLLVLMAATPPLLLDLPLRPQGR